MTKPTEAVNKIMYVLANDFFKFSSSFFLMILATTQTFVFYRSSLTLLYSRYHSQSLYLIQNVSQLLLSCPILLITLARLLARFDNELAIHCAQPINCHLQDDL